MLKLGDIVTLSQPSSVVRQRPFFHQTMKQYIGTKIKVKELVTHDNQQYIVAFGFYWHPDWCNNTGDIYDHLMASLTEGRNKASSE